MNITMWHHFVNVLFRSGEALVRACGTTVFGIILFAVAIPVAAFVLAGLWARFIEKKTGQAVWRDSFRYLVVTLCAVLLILACVYPYFVVTTVYTDHTNLVANVNQLQKENRSLRDDLAHPKPTPQEPEESADSLRRRTGRLAGDLALFWAEKGQTPPGPQPNAKDDPDRERVQKFEKWWRAVETDYAARHFNERILGIVREYKAKGISVGSLEAEAEQQPMRMIGGPQYGGSALETCSSLYPNEICQLEELAYHVDAHDKPIFLTVEKPKLNGAHR